TVILSDDAPGTATATATGTATVIEADTLVGSATLTATEGTAFNGAVATFTDNGFPGNVASDFTASFIWGDGTTTAGPPTPTPATATTATRAARATPPAAAPGPAPAAPPAPATVAEADVLAAGPSTHVTLTPSDRPSFSGVVGTFTDTGFPGNTASDFTATID